MSLSEKEVEHIARLARLAITPQERKTYQDQLGKILDSMNELRALETSSVSPTSHVLGLSNVMREDEPRRFTDGDKLLELSPQRDGPYFKVRKVIE